MKQFNVVLKNQPGELAKLCDELKAVNILQITTERADHMHTAVKVVTSDDNSTRNALGGKFNFSEIDLLRVKMMDRPGELGKLAKMLGEARVNITDVYSLDKGLFALIINEPEKERARTALKSFLVE